MYRLALRMGRTVGELSATLTVDELAHWYAFDRKSPIGDTRLDTLVALICRSIHDAQGVTKRGGARFTLEDFMLFDKVAASDQTPQQVMRGWFAGAVKKQKRPKVKG